MTTPTPPPPRDVCEYGQINDQMSGEISLAEF